MTPLVSRSQTPISKVRPFWHLQFAISVIFDFLQHFSSFSWNCQSSKSYNFTFLLHQLPPSCLNGIQCREIHRSKDFSCLSQYCHIFHFLVKTIFWSSPQGFHRATSALELDPSWLNFISSPVFKNDLFFTAKNSLQSKQCSMYHLVKYEPILFSEGPDDRLSMPIL